jgi:hypothetical protein
LLEKLDKSFLHKELLVESIMTPLVLSDTIKDKRALGNIFMALHGQKKELDFEVGQIVECSREFYRNGACLPIGECVVTAVEPLRFDETIEVEFQYFNQKENLITERKYVYPSELRDIQGRIEADLSAYETTMGEPSSY